MPTVLRVDGLRVAIYLNDHAPAHFHVIGPGWSIVVNLIGLELREVIGCGERETGRALRMIAEHQAMLLEAWNRLHG